MSGGSRLGKASRRLVAETPRGLKWPFTPVLALVLVTLSVATASPFVAGDYSPSYCVISNVHVNSITPTDYSSTMVHVITTFSLDCSSGGQGTVWNVETKVFAESNLVGVTGVSTSENQYTVGQGTVQYVVNNQFDAMNYYGYGDQTPSFYVQITTINTSTGSLDAQTQTPFAVDTSQYPFNLEQQNYCHFPGLSQFFQLLPGCGGSANITVNTGPSSSTCNTYGLPQFLQPYLPGCGGTGGRAAGSNQSVNEQSPLQQPGSSLNPPTNYPSPATTTSASSDSSIEAILGIIISALVVFVVAGSIMMKPSRLRAFHFHTHQNQQGKFCPACGIGLESTANFCWRCGEPSPDSKDTVTFRI